MMSHQRQRLAFTTTIVPLSITPKSRNCTCSPRALRVSTLHGATLHTRIQLKKNTYQKTTTMVFGGGGFLGVGAPEVFVIFAVGWFVLGPKQLLALSRDIGKVIGDLRKATSEARTTFTDAIEVDLAVMEARKIATPVEGPALPNQERPVLESDDELVAKNDVIQAANEQQQPLGPARDTKDKFLDQLKRVADPEQTSTVRSNVPDLSLSEEEEIKMLEERLKQAKERMQKNNSRSTPSTSLKDDGGDTA